VRVRSVEIENFRGVERTSLEDCGSLNVLIGKNNSGKSTVLDAINGFFNMVGHGAVVQLDSPLAKATNFRRGAVHDDRMKITVRFLLTKDEHEAILESVVSEAPQMRHALEGVDRVLDLLVTVSGTRGRSQYAYVERVSLVHPADLQPERLLLAVSPEAGSELHAKVREATRARRTGTDLERLFATIDADDFQRLRNRDREMPRSYQSPLLGRFASLVSDRSVVYTVESLMKEAGDFGEFRQRLDSLTQTTYEDAKRTESAPLTTPIETFTGHALSVPEHVQMILALVGQYSFLHLRDRREPVGREEARRLLALKVRRGGPEILRSIQETVQALMGVAIDAFESSSATASRTRPDELSAEMDVDEVLVEMNGAGIREALRLVLDNELSNPDLLLVEEPEIHLHPALEMSMLRYLKTASERAQIFVTTHSTNFLDTSEMRNVYLVSRDPWVDVRLLDYAEAEEAIPAQLGLRLSSLFMYDRLVFVEGPSDESVLRELASKLGVNFGRAGVGFVVIGGARNFTHYATQATLAFLTKRRVSMMFVLDRDESTDEEVERLKTLVGTAATLHLLDRREMENYLAIPRPLAAFIEWKRELSGQPATTVPSEDVERFIQEVADDLRETTVNRRLARSFCKPIYPSRERLLEPGQDRPLEDRLVDEADRLREEMEARVEHLRSVAEEERRVAQEQWGNKKLALVPGDELLDGVCQRYEVRFRKERDAQRLASLLHAEEVPAALRTLLSKIVNG
jgi:putative ATP-dependent endonuclease of OLD family